MILKFRIPHNAQFLIDWESSLRPSLRGSVIYLEIPIEGIGLEVVYSVRVLDMLTAEWYTLSFMDTGNVSVSGDSEVCSGRMSAWVDRMESSYESLGG